MTRQSRVTAGTTDELPDIPGLAVVAGEVTGLEITEDRLTGVRLRTGELIPQRALAVAPRAVPRAAVLATLGLEPTPHPSGLGAYIAADMTGLTPVPGVWVAGNLADPAANVLAAAASGSGAAGAINADPSPRTPTAPCRPGTIPSQPNRKPASVHRSWATGATTSDPTTQGKDNGHTVLGRDVSQP